MVSFSLPLFSLLLLFFSITTTTQSYKAAEHFLLDCGSSTSSDQNWQGDDGSKFVPSNITTTSVSSSSYYLDPSINVVPYSTARIFTASPFTYTFPVSNGPKFIRLYFYPANYSNLKANESFFSVSSNGYSLLTNFSPFLAALYLAKTRSEAGDHGPSVPSFVKEFVIYVKDTKFLTVTFTPSPNSYAFINGIEIVSMPENLYFNTTKPKPVGWTTGPVIVNNITALETIYRLNVGGGYISGNNDPGLYRSWDQDDNYIYGASVGIANLDETPITYTPQTPSYTAPKQVYQTQRSMGYLANLYNLTWTFPVDSGFFYMLRLHFCSNITKDPTRYHVVFKVFINNQTAEDELDLFYWTRGSGYPVYKDYVVFVDDSEEGGKSKKDLWLALHPNSKFTYYLDAYLNGLEVFKLSIMDRNLSSPNPEVSPAYPQPKPVSSIKGKKKTPPYATIIGGVAGGVVFLMLILVLIYLRKREQIRPYSSSNHETSSGPVSSDSALPSDRCHRFSLKEMKIATNEFNENSVIGNGGFGKVYKGYMDHTTILAIKRLKASSSQGIQEFLIEIRMLSILRHVNLVSLIGYCDENEEMILVYEYMEHGTLREHLYKTNYPSLSWKTRLHICIGAAKGLHYLHTSAKRTIIHRDIKSTNILLNENWIAKVSDFGLSKLGSKDPSQTHVSTMVKGSIGYIDPGYCKRKQLTDKSDVYSFGVVLFEVLCARPVILRQMKDEQVSLAEWGKTCYRRGTLSEITDSKLDGQIDAGCLRKFGEVANSCLHEDGNERPTMDEVVWGLEFALQLQEAADKMGEETNGDSAILSDNQELPLATVNGNEMEERMRILSG